MGEPSPSWIKSNHHGILVFEDARNDSLGHNSEAVHVAYANRALMKIPQDYKEHMAIKTQAISPTNKTDWNLCKSLEPWFLNQTSERYAI